jgi:demethylmenaquinone methyltransferase/2-methoxy-6-polyprenyl-1,4-benzoquinol methylase
MENDIYNPEYVKSLFNKMSSSYERMNYITSFGFSIRWRNQYIKKFNKTNDKVYVIDLLTGMGESWSSIKKVFPNSNITALDFSDGMLAFADKKNSNKFNSEITLIQRDILNSNLPENQFDYVTCAFGLKTFNEEQLKKIAEETKRILKPGGQFSFVEVSKPQNIILYKLYGLYLGKVIPVLGKLFLGNPIEYKMLWKYTLKFENAKYVAEIFKKVGLKVEYNSYFFGCASGFSGQKV